MYKFAAARGYFHGLPATAGLTKRQARTKKSRSLTENELQAFWIACEEYGYPFGLATKPLTLTGQRRDEIGESKWSDIDFEKRLLTIPSSRSKNRKVDHEVPLSEVALDVLAEVNRAYKIQGVKSEYIFTTNGGSPISGWSKAGPRLDRYNRAYLAGLSQEEKSTVALKGKLRPDTIEAKWKLQNRLDAIDLPHWRFHDLRHTVVTKMRNGKENNYGETVFAIPLDVIQQVVNHELTVGVTGLYDHGDIEKRYRLRKKEALGWWGRKLRSIVSSEQQADNIVNLGQLSA